MKVTAQESSSREFGTLEDLTFTFTLHLKTRQRKPNAHPAVRKETNGRLEYRGDVKSMQEELGKLAFQILSANRDKYFPGYDVSLQ
jgi:hypothetical protein